MPKTKNCVKTMQDSKNELKLQEGHKEETN